METFKMVLHIISDIAFAVMVICILGLALINIILWAMVLFKKYFEDNKNVK